MTNEEFYRECARLLGCHDYDGEPFKGHKRTRWNNRAPGQGRYPGHGIIRVFGEQVHVSLHHPKIMTVCSREEVLALLGENAGA